MKFSVTLGTGDGRDPAALARLAALAESAGWDAFFLEDYLCYRGLPTYDPWVCLAAIAVATTRIRLGTTVTPLPRRQPWELAAQAVAIDHLSAPTRRPPPAHRLGRRLRLPRPGLLAEAAGASWWGQWIPPGHPDETRTIIAAGPPALS